MSGCKYITISYNILSDKRLNSTDKLVYGIIESACRMYDSCCTMSNDTIAKILNTTTRTIQSSISKLVKYKFIYRKIENANESYIKLRSMTVIQDTDTTKNTSYPHEENFTPPMKKTSHKYNNKNNNHMNFINIIIINNNNNNNKVRSAPRRGRTPEGDNNL